MPGSDLANSVIGALRRDGWQALLVGGCVRDRLLGLNPKDYDVATDAIPEQIAIALPRAEPVGAHFGVMLVPGREESVEVATFRSEAQYTDGRRPDAVAFVREPALDARRRDFTVNGLFEDPLTGQILDYVGGQADLKAGVIRAIGDPAVRFEEDHLRMLRAVRFAARLEFAIEPATLGGIQRQAQKIVLISAERIRDEILRILVQGHARRGFELLDETGLLAHVLPRVKAFQDVAQPPEYHPEGDVWTHVLMMLEEMGRPEPALALGVLLHDVAKPATFRVADRIRFDGHAELGAEMAREILAALKFPNDDIDQTVALVANHMKFKDVGKMRLSTLKRFMRLPHFEQHLELHRLDCLASNGRTEAYDFVREKLAELSVDDLRPPRLLSGADLIRAGYVPGPSFGVALEAVESAQLDGEIGTAEEALAVARRVLERRGC